MNSLVNATDFTDRIMNSLHRLTLIVLTITAAGCGIQKEYVKAYEGSALDAKQVALVKPLPAIIVESIDGDRSRKIVVTQHFGSVDADIALAPGEHRFSLNVKKTLGNGTVFQSQSELSIVQKLEAGHRYLLTYSEPAPRTWTPELKDVTDQPGLWCLNSPRC